MRACVFLVCLGFGTFGAALTAIGASALIQILGVLALVALTFAALFAILSSGHRLVLAQRVKAAGNM